jgi:trehalose 6-phosphate synthase
LPVLALIAWGASAAIDEAGRRWFVRDTEMRGRLAVTVARENLARHWLAGDREGLARSLVDLTRDERIMSALACTLEGAAVARTPAVPPGVDCGTTARRVMAPDENGVPHEWHDVQEAGGGRIHVSAFPLVELDQPVGFLVLVHDMSYADRRESLARRVSLGAVVLLALAAAAATALGGQVAWRRWTAEMRRQIRGGTRRREFQPLMRDIHDLAGRLALEAAEEKGGLWGPERLTQALRRHLHGEKVVLIANREPYIHERTGGEVKVLHPASGLVTALEPVMQACSGVWIAHGSGSADREMSDARGRVAVPPGKGSYWLRRVWLTPEEEQGYYFGFANEGLWPLCHVAHTRPTFRREDWEHYRTVNQRFADAAAEEVEGPDAVVLAQDYHFALLPRMLRARLPRATILTFWHIPWPNAERLGICPWAPELLEGMLGSSIIGFHTQLHCNNFLEAVDRFLEARIDREQQGVVLGGRLTLVRPYPISIEWPSRWLAGAPSVEECRRGLRAQLGLPGDALLGVGVDRLDYTKGIEERLLTVERLLESAPHLVGRFAFVQLAAPSRTKIGPYAALAARVEELAERINARFARGSYRPIALLRSHHEPPDVFRCYRAADFCYVSSLHDGMNLVAKEFVAARDDNRGVLVLSSFTGAARELTGALIVNPYDLDQASAALLLALEMEEEEQADRMAAMRAHLAEFNVYRWAGRMVVDAARHRQRDRLTGRLLPRLGRGGATEG